jgi:hypothetical protein
MARTAKLPKAMGFRCSKDLEAWLKKQAAGDEREVSDWIRRHFQALMGKRKTTVDGANARG